jgi:hypothetical protein
MSLVCKLAHDWDGCRCKRCGLGRDWGHDWDSSTCQRRCRRCGRVAEPHPRGQVYLCRPCAARESGPRPAPAQAGLAAGVIARFHPMGVRNAGDLDSYVEHELGLYLPQDWMVRKSGDGQLAWEIVPTGTAALEAAPRSYELRFQEELDGYYFLYGQSGVADPPLRRVLLSAWEHPVTQSLAIAAKRLLQQVPPNRLPNAAAARRAASAPPVFRTAGEAAGYVEKELELNRPGLHAWKKCDGCGLAWLLLTQPEPFEPPLPEPQPGPFVVETPEWLAYTTEAFELKISRDLGLVFIEHGHPLVAAGLPADMQLDHCPQDWLSGRRQWQTSHVIRSPSLAQARLAEVIRHVLETYAAHSVVPCCPHCSAYWVRGPVQLQVA